MKRPLKQVMTKIDGLEPQKNLEGDSEHEIRGDSDEAEKEGMKGTGEREVERREEGKGV